MCWIADVILTNVAMQPVAEVQETVVERQQNVGHHSVHFRRNPSFNLLRRHVDDFLANEFLIGWIFLVEAENIRVNTSTDEALASLRIVKEANLQWSDA